MTRFLSKTRNKRSFILSVSVNRCRSCYKMFSSILLARWIPLFLLMVPQVAQEFCAVILGSNGEKNRVRPEHLCHRHQDTDNDRSVTLKKIFFLRWIRYMYIVSINNILGYTAASKLVTVGK